MTKVVTYLICMTLVARVDCLSCVLFYFRCITSLPAFNYFFFKKKLKDGLRPQGEMLDRYFMFWARTFKPDSVLARIASNVIIFQQFFEPYVAY